MFFFFPGGIFQVDIDRNCSIDGHPHSLKDDRPLNGPITLECQVDTICPRIRSVGRFIPTLILRRQWIDESIVLSFILLMEEILHQLRLVVYPIIYKVLYIPGPRWCRISAINSRSVRVSHCWPSPPPGVERCHMGYSCHETDFYGT